ncbi:MAG: hypothetical protein AAGA46_00045 [Cyanobacteria bacterium P01_F01_bin.13]
MPKPASGIDAKISEINLRLKMDGFGVAIQTRGKGNFLSLVATLPPKPDSQRSKPYQQRISLGYGASVPGLRQAETQARLLATQMINQSFRWDAWWEPSKPANTEKPGSEHLISYKDYVFQNRLNSEKYGAEDLEALWRRRFWDKGLSKLNVDRAISLRDFEAIAQQVTPGSAQARYVVVELRHFAKFCGLTGVDDCLKPYQGNYNPKKPQNDRVVPPDEEIETLISQIINPEWRYVFGMMATFGLRNHEVWNARLEQRSRDGKDFAVCFVSDGKTGSREVYPMPSRWIGVFNLSEPKLPKLSVSRVRLGEKTARAFRRQCERIGGLPEWRPYSLRHAYAIRCITAGLPDAISSKWMGHSIVTFREIYSKWISRTQSEDIWLELDM